MEISNLSLKEKSPKTTTTCFYTGTSCINMQPSRVRGAVCICRDESEDSTVIELLSTELCTNQKAELHAIYRALSMVVEEENIIVVSGSEYAVKCITEWSSKWKDRKKRTIHNIELIESITELLNELTESKKSVEICHAVTIPNALGNKVAQKLAKEAVIRYS